ncbi:MAG: VpsF family polysaccharide biosynthesis protein [Candidatus Competibacter denitrificans]
MATTGVRSAVRICYPVNPANRRYRATRRPWRLSFWLACMGLILYLLMSNNFLVSWGIPYDTPGGAFIFKLHPGTYLISLGFMLLFFQGSPRARWSELFTNAAAPLLLAAVVIGILIYTLIRFGPSGNAFFIDSLLAPALLAVVLLDSPLPARRFVFWVILVLLTINALLAVGEAVTGWRLTPYMSGDQPIIDDYFRSTALGGHPLNNAVRTSMFLITCLILPRLLILFLIPLLVAALMTFGGRTALILSLLVLMAWGSYHFIHGIVRRTFDVRLIFGLIFIAVILGGSVVGLTMGLGLGGRIFENLAWDDSAQSRILIFKAFEYVRMDEWLWGMGPARILEIEDILRASTSLSYLENFWLQLLMYLGLIWFFLLSSTLLGLIASLTWRAPSPLNLSAGLFLVLISTNNSLAVKSQDLAIFVAHLIGSVAEAEVRSRQLRHTSKVSRRDAL